MSHNNPILQYRLGDKCLESCPADKNLEVLVNSYQDMSQKSNTVAKEWPCIRNSVVSQIRKLNVPLHTALVRIHLKHCIQFWAPLYRKDIELIKHGQRRATKLVREAEAKTYEEQLRELRLFSLEEVEGRPHHSLQLPKRR